MPTKYKHSTSIQPDIMKKPEAENCNHSVHEPAAASSGPVGQTGSERDGSSSQNVSTVVDTVKLSPEQEGVMGLAIAGQNILITGSAGTGKSTLLRALHERLGDLPVCASTGIAAVNVGGLTMHSWAGIGLGDGKPDAIARGIIDRKGEAFYRITRSDRVAIDEVSMISAKLFTMLDRIFRLVRKEKRKPFGGMQLILFGDFLQLPPVIKDPAEVREFGKFCFESKSWDEANIRVCMLTQVFRQTDRVFSSALNDIRMGEIGDDAKTILNARYKVEDTSPGIEPVIVHTHNVDVDETNNVKLSLLPGEVQAYKADDYGRESQLKVLRKNCLAPELLELKIDAQVMLLKNLDPENGLANGSIGKVTGFKSGSRCPIVLFANGDEIEVQHAQWHIKDGKQILASRTQLPLRLAWSITVHKSQGMTLDKISVHLHKVFEFGQAYVALSRARTAEGLFIHSGNRTNIMANPVAVEFYRSGGKNTGTSHRERQEELF